MFGDMYVHAIEQYVLHNNPKFMMFLKELEQPPVSIEDFLDSTDFMGATDLQLWPEVRQAIVDINKDWWKGPGIANKEAVLAGATRTGKTEIGKVCIAYHLHILGCMKAPQKVYSLPSETSIIFIIQGAKPHVTKKVVYTPLRKYIEKMPWFQNYLRPNKLIESEMYFEEKNFRIVPGGSDADSVLGEAVIGGVLDEVNFMHLVAKSKKTEVGTGRTASYDQAQVMYDTVSRRKKGTFLYQGPQLGILCVSSSTRYKGDFTDKRIKQVETTGERGVYIYNKAQYEVWPQERYSGDIFRVYVANEAAMDIRILDDEEKTPNVGTIFEVPVEYKDDFVNDPAGALRDIVGRSVNAINPFFRRRFKITEAIERGIERGLESFLYKDNVILGFEGMPQVKQGHYCKNPSRPRYVHIDLSANGDRCGIAMIRYDGMENMERANGETEFLPTATVELAVSIEPDHGNEIDIAEIRAWVKTLKTVYGYPIKVVSYDGWNSLESRQQWRKQGMITGLVSVDKTVVPYMQLRDCFNDGRITLYEQEVLTDELYGLEFDESANGGKGKIDHPMSGGKDVADAVCGAYNTMLRRSETWTGLNEDIVDNPELSGREDYNERFDDDRPM
jgi:hypothetical protein